MKSRFYKFNIYLALITVCLAAGCSTYRANRAFAKGEQSTIRLYLEGSSADPAGSGPVLVTSNKFLMSVERQPFLTEADLRKVVLLDDPGKDGGFSIGLVFKDHGAMLLEMATTRNRGRHIVVFAQFPPKGYKAPKAQKKPRKSDDDDDQDKMDAQLDVQLPGITSEMDQSGQPRAAGWLAAVLIRERNTSGIFRFSPDASREEAKRIVRGLKNDMTYAKTIGKDTD
jgi:hypothetical protein